jgi:hypothetical protein
MSLCRGVGGETALKENRKYRLAASVINLITGDNMIQ